MRYLINREELHAELDRILYPVENLVQDLKRRLDIAVDQLDTVSQKVREQRVTRDVLDMLDEVDSIVDAHRKGQSW